MSISTVGELASKVHASVRTLEEGFRKHLDTFPMAYLRRTRLHRARRDLQLADPSTTTVRRIANLWGFQDLGRFAQCYRDVFGELPVETLRRTPRWAQLRLERGTVQRSALLMLSDTWSLLPARRHERICTPR